MSESQKKNIWDWISNLALVRFLLLFASGWAFLQLLAYFETVIVVFTFSSIVAFLLSYPVGWLQRFLPRGLAVGLVFLLSLVFVGGLTITVGLALLSQGQQLIDSVTKFVNALAPLSERTEAFLRERNLQVNLRVIEEQLRTQALAVVVSSIAILQVFITNLVSLILIWVVSFFMLIDGERLWRLVLKIIPAHLQERLTVTIQRNFLAFFQGQLVLMLFMIISSFLVLLGFQVNFPLALAVILGIFDLVPGIGATLGISLISFIVLAQNVWLALKVLVACIILQQIRDNLIYPRIMRNSLNIHPVVVFFALLIGARAAGLLGIFLAIPIAGVLVSWFEIEEMKGEGEVRIREEKMEI
ncbi:MAG: AI-2E family transporter [Oscillatoria princeps RMCB-10]|jgi:predicted PurR-regulated permease PerM|nr:AI-2E family transporter [Oscillatoria princeps RMCB-10]